MAGSVAVEIVAGVRHVIVGASHDCSWFNLDVTCTICACHALLTVCTCVWEVPCPDCGHRNHLPDVTLDAD